MRGRRTPIVLGDGWMVNAGTYFMVVTSGRIGCR
jgi:hypothetical protein